MNEKATEKYGRYPNLTELVENHPYHFDTFKNFANVTAELFKEVLYGDEELTREELLNICRYTNTPYPVLHNPKLITLDSGRMRHQQMMDELKQTVHEMENLEDKCGYEISVQVAAIHFERMEDDFHRERQISYCRYLGVRQEILDVFSFIRTDLGKKNNRPRGLSVRKAV